MEADADRDSEYGTALRLPESTEDARWPALERPRYSQSTLYHRGQPDASVLQRRKTISLYPRRVSERRPLQQRDIGPREIFRAAADQRQLRSPRRPGLGDQPEDDSARRLRALLGRRSGPQPVCAKRPGTRGLA